MVVLVRRSHDADTAAQPTVVHGAAQPPLIRFRVVNLNNIISIKHVRVIAKKSKMSKVTIDI